MRHGRRTAASMLVAAVLCAYFPASPPGAATASDEPAPPASVAASTAAVTGRLLIERNGGGQPVPVRDGFVALYPANESAHEPVAVVELSPEAPGNFSLSGVPPGAYRIALASYDSRALPVREWWPGSVNQLGATSVTLTPGGVLGLGDVLLNARVIAQDRFAGVDRYATAVQVNKAAASDEGSRDVVIVSGLDFPDALSAGPLAGSAGASVLMATRDNIPSSTRRELERLDIGTITIVGGPGVISDAVRRSLESFVDRSSDVRRISGNDRYATSRAVVNAIESSNGVTELFLVTGRDFPDALAAVPAATRVGGAVLLVDGRQGRLDEASRLLIARLQVPVTIVGGASVVSTGIATELSTAGVSTRRVFGDSRYGTSVDVAIEFFPAADSAIVATGVGFADALAVGAFAGAEGRPVYLSQPTCMPAVVLADIQLGMYTDLTLMGGNGALSPAVAALSPCGS